jgi:hypothetical protein
MGKRIRENHFAFALLQTNTPGCKPFYAGRKTFAGKYCRPLCANQSTMKRLPVKGKAGAGNFSLTEKIIMLYLGLYAAKDQLFKRIDKAFYGKKIYAGSRKFWKRFFGDECASCANIPLNTYRDCAFLEFKVRRLMKTAGNLQFRGKKPRQDH